MTARVRLLASSSPKVDGTPDLIALESCLSMKTSWYWVRLFDEPGTPATESRLLRPVTIADQNALAVFAHQRSRFVDGVHFWTPGFHEKEQKNDGTIVWKTETPDRIERCVFQGPHILNACPMGQQPNPDCKNNTDWSPLDIEVLPEAFIPRTNYQVGRLPVHPMGRYPFWEGKPYTARFREAHREFVGTRIRKNAAGVPASAWGRTCACRDLDCSSEFVSNGTLGRPALFVAYRLPSETTARRILPST